MVAAWPTAGGHLGQGASRLKKRRLAEDGVTVMSWVVYDGPSEWHGAVDDGVSLLVRGRLGVLV